MFTWTNKNGAIEAAPKMFPAIHGKFAELKVVECINYAIVDQQLKTPRLYPVRPPALQFDVPAVVNGVQGVVNPTSKELQRSSYQNATYKDSVKEIDDINSKNFEIQHRHRTASLVFETLFPHDSQLVLAMRAHAKVLDANVETARLVCEAVLPAGPNNVGGLIQMMSELREGAILDPVVIAPAYNAWDIARVAALPVSKFRYAYDFLRELCKPDDVAYAKLIADFYALTDAKMKFCKFESAFDRLKELLDLSGHPLTQHVIETQLCAAITNINFKTEVNFLRIDLQKPTALRQHSEDTLRFNIRALIIIDSALDSPISSLRSNNVSTDGSNPSANAVQGAPKPKPVKAARPRKVQIQSSALKSALKTSGIRVDPRDPANASEVAALLVRFGKPTATTVCTRCNRSGHHTFQCYSFTCSKCLKSLGETEFHKVGGSQCK